MSVRWLFCEEIGRKASGGVYYWSYIYYLSKYVEFIDTLFKVGLGPKPKHLNAKSLNPTPIHIFPRYTSFHDTHISTHTHISTNTHISTHAHISTQVLKRKPLDFLHVYHHAVVALMCWNWMTFSQSLQVH